MKRPGKSDAEKSPQKMFCNAARDSYKPVNAEYRAENIYTRKVKRVEIMTVDIYLSSLSEYVGGNDNGEWLTLPMSNKELTNKFNEIVGDGKEWIILDSSVSSLISEYENVFSLNNFLLEVNKDFRREEIAVLSKIVDTLDDLKELFESESYTVINADEISDGWAVYNEECWGMVLNECGYNNLFSQPIPEEMVDYIDFENIWRNLSINDGWQSITVNDVTYLVTTKF